MTRFFALAFVLAFAAGCPEREPTADEIFRESAAGIADRVHEQQDAKLQPAREETAKMQRELEALKRAEERREFDEAAKKAARE